MRALSEMSVWGFRPVRIQVKIWNFALITYYGTLGVQLRESTVPYLRCLFKPTSEHMYSTCRYLVYLKISSVNMKTELSVYSTMLYYRVPYHISAPTDIRQIRQYRDTY
jgi:hypothetical protein